MATMQAPAREGFGEEAEAAIREAVEMFGPTVTLDTAVLFSAMGALGAAGTFLNRLSCGDIDPFGDHPSLLDQSDLGALDEAFSRTIGEVAEDLAEAVVGDVAADDDNYDDDPRIVAYDKGWLALEGEWVARIGKAFSPELQSARTISEVSTKIDSVGYVFDEGVSDADALVHDLNRAASALARVNESLGAA